MFATWGRQLPEGVALLPVELPGRNPRRGRPALTDFERLIDELVPAATAALQPPFVLLGHSLGAVVAFELARRLQAAGAPPPLALMATAARAPQLPSLPRHAAQLPAAELRDLLQRFEGLPAEALDHPGLRELLLPPLLADLELLDGYRFRPGPALSCPLWVWGGADDTLVPPEALQPWSELTTASFSLRLLQGGHFFFRERGSTFLHVLGQVLLGLL